MRSLNSAPALEPPFQLADDPMMCACAAFCCCNVCAGCVSIYLANDARAEALGGRRESALASAERSRFWANVAVCLGVVSIIAAVIFFVAKP